MAARKSALSIIFLTILCSFIFSPAHGSAKVRREEFNEELLLRPLPDRKVLAHFYFESKAYHSNYGGDHLRLFSKAIYQLVRKFHIREMELSFTQGRWDYERWGGFDTLSNANAKPPGVELWAVFDVPPSEVDATWRNLTHTLSGLFCASINFLESSTLYSAPKWESRIASGSLRYGTLPREAVCTENLTPWLKLLPCRDKAGLSELMDRPSIYRGFYHSQRLKLTSNSFEQDSEIRLEQTLTVVLLPRSQKGLTSSTSSSSTVQPNWSMSSIFGKKVNGKCIPATYSNVYLQLDQGLVSKLKSLRKKKNDDSATFVKSLLGSELELSVAPDKLIRESSSLNSKELSILYLFLLERHVSHKPFDLALTWKLPVIWLCPQAPLRANRFLMGSGNERGAIAISLKSTENTGSFLDDIRLPREEECEQHVDIFQVVPWYVKVYYHTMKIYVDGQIQPVSNVSSRILVSPSEDKVSPGLLELLLKFPCRMKSAAITLEFDKGFLHIDEYPPDANQGFDIPSAMIGFPDFQSKSNFDEDSSSLPLLTKLQEKSLPQAYTEVLLVPLTTPDFSMPYNVITITCTVFALYFGSLLNVLRRRAGEEERRLRDRASKKGGRIIQLLNKLSAKLRGRPYEQPPSESNPTPSSQSSSSRSKLLLKVTLVAAFAVAWKYYSG